MHPAAIGVSEKKRSEDQVEKECEKEEWKNLWREYVKGQNW